MVFKGQYLSLGLMFCGVYVLALIQVLFYNWLLMVIHVWWLINILWWLVTGLGFLGFYGVSRTLTIDLRENLWTSLLVIFGGAHSGSAVGMGILALTQPLWRAHLAHKWANRSYFIVQITFMAFVGVSLAYFRAQGRSGLRRQGSEPNSAYNSLILLFGIVFVLGIIKDGHDALLFKELDHHLQSDLWILIKLWLGIMVLCFGWYSAGRLLQLSLHTNPLPVILVVFGGAYCGSTVVSLLSAEWRLLESPWFLQIFFMAFTAVSVAHLQNHKARALPPL